MRSITHLVAGLAISGLTVAGSMIAGTSATLAGNDGVRVGTLTCEQVGKRLNLIIHSSVDVTCVFKSSTGQIERYRGETGIGLGIDLNWKRVDKIAFAVISAGQDIRPGAYALAGKYFGGKVNVTAGAGVGVAALVGGGKKGIAFQPIALETSTGVGVAGGLGYLYLEPNR
ncbi:MAG: DUF992 domain-containing protein [Alphaproteobacteria bacterium]